jgi:hypothetical protein
MALLTELKRGLGAQILWALGQDGLSLACTKRANLIARQLCNLFRYFLHFLEQGNGVGVTDFFHARINRTIDDK